MFADATRRIKAARLKGKSEPLIRRGAILLEDALRTASMPGIEQGRLLLIRSVSLGLIYADKSAAVVARQLERQIADLARDAVHGRDPRAASAQAVYFHDRLDAVIVLIQQLARGGSGGGVHTWYWTQAIPGWRPDFTSEEAGRFLLGVLLNLGHGVQFLGQAFQRLVETRCIEVILHAIREQDGPVLMQQCGWDSLGSVPMVRLRLSVDENRIRLPYASRSVLREWVFRWGPSDVRSLWLTMLAVQSWRSETVVSTEVQAQAEVLLRTIIGLSAPSPVPCAVEVQEGPSGNVEPDRMLQIEGSTMAEGLPPAKVGLHDFSMALPGSDLQEWPSRNVELDRPDYSEESEVVEVDCNRHDVPLYTAYAGFWFLIPLLVRVGFGRAVEDHPEWIDTGVPHRLLSSLADRLGIPPDDPVRLWLSDETVDACAGNTAMCDTELAEELDAIVAGWRMSMRRWCRLHARLGLANVVRRPGWIMWDKTHVEVRMPLRNVDLRIRRAGLDLDLGWVPWMGQVIRFYYDAEGKFHETGGIAGR